MIDINEYSEEIPICPHCEMSLTSLLARRIKSTLGIRFLSPGLFTNRGYRRCEAQGVPL